MMLTGYDVLLWRVLVLAAIAVGFVALVLAVRAGVSAWHSLARRGRHRATPSRGSRDATGTGAAHAPAVRDAMTYVAGNDSSDRLHREAA
jgi:hypothetical protein